MTERGGVLFIGGASDRRFRAYETKTGRELWSVETEQIISGANPVTYMAKDGKQYVAVARGGHAADLHPAATIAAVPRRRRPPPLCMTLHYTDSRGGVSECATS